MLLCLLLMHVWSICLFQFRPIWCKIMTRKKKWTCQSKTQHLTISSANVLMCMFCWKGRRTQCKWQGMTTKQPEVNRACAELCWMYRGVFLVSHLIPMIEIQQDGDEPQNKDSNITGLFPSSTGVSQSTRISWKTIFFRSSIQKDKLIYCT